MGTKHSLFSSKELQLYEELTGLNAAEIAHAYKRFRQIDPLSKGDISYLTVAENLKELKVNPLRYHVCKIFCSSESGLMDFEDFLDMVSVFNSNGSVSKKVAWAFKIFDFNGDEGIDGDDMRTLLDLLTANDLAEGVKEGIIEKVLEVADRDQDEIISFEEFQRHLHFYPEFRKRFTFNL